MSRKTITRVLDLVPALLTAVGMGAGQLGIWFSCGRPVVGLVAGLVTAAGWLVVALGCRE